MAEQVKPIRTCDLDVLKSMLLTEEDRIMTNKPLENDESTGNQAENLIDDSENQYVEYMSDNSEKTSNHVNEFSLNEENENEKVAEASPQSPNNKENEAETKSEENKPTLKKKRKKMKSKQSKIKTTQNVEYSNRRLHFGRLDQNTWQESASSSNRFKSSESVQKPIPVSSQFAPQNRSQHRLPPPKIVTNEERLNQKYSELENLLSRDLLQETSEICHQTVREARQLLHSSLAATRIISEPIKTTSQYSTRSKQSRTRTRSNEEISVTPRSEDRASRDRSQYDSHDNDESYKSLPRRQRVKSGSSQKQSKLGRASSSMGNHSMEDSKLNPHDRRHEKEGFSFPSPRPQIRREGYSTGTYLYGFGVEKPPGFNEMQQKRMAKGSDNQLSKTDNPFIQRWLKRKNRLLKNDKKIKREDERLEKELDEELEIIKQQRADISARYYQSWLEKKTKEIKNSHSDQPKTKNDSSESEEEIEDCEGRVMGRRPRTAPHHVHNYVYKRGQSPPMKPIAGYGAPKKRIGIKISGKKLQTNADSTADAASSRKEAIDKLRLSYDDWLKNKRMEFQDQHKRREAAENAARAAAHIDEDLKNILPEMARRRIQNKRNLSKRSSSRDSKPETTKKSSDDETQENSETQEKLDNQETKDNYIWRADSQGNLVRVNSAKLRSTTGLADSGDSHGGSYRPVTSMDRRVDEITCDHPNPYSESVSSVLSVRTSADSHQNELVNNRISELQLEEKLENSLIDAKMVTALPPPSPNKTEDASFEFSKEGRKSWSKSSVSPTRSSTKSLNEDSDPEEVAEDLEFDFGNDSDDLEDNSQIPKLNLEDVENDADDNKTPSQKRDSVEFESDE